MRCDLAIIGIDPASGTRHTDCIRSSSLGRCAMVFEVDRFRLVTAHEVAIHELAEGTTSVSQACRLRAPLLLGARTPRTGAESTTMRSLRVSPVTTSAAGRSFGKPYEQSRARAIEKSRPIERLARALSQRAAALGARSWPNSGADPATSRFLPAVARGDWVVVLDPGGNVLGYCEGTAFSDAGRRHWRSGAASPAAMLSAGSPASDRRRAADPDRLQRRAVGDLLQPGGSVRRLGRLPARARPRALPRSAWPRSRGALALLAAMTLGDDQRAWRRRLRRACPGRCRSRRRERSCRRVLVDRGRRLGAARRPGRASPFARSASAWSSPASPAAPIGLVQVFAPHAARRRLDRARRRSSAARPATCASRIT